jgi:DNA-binding NtrC family response regulator
LLQDSNGVDCILLDVKMPGMDGIETLKKLREIRSDIPIIMISGHGTIETAVEATKLGAFDFLEKPPDRERLLVLVRNATDKHNLEEQVITLREQLHGRETMLGNSPAMRNIRALIERIAPTSSNVLITGENGSGKELVARAIHRQSPRKDKPFVEVNCAAIPGELIESELFGHEKGSFTGAHAQRTGKFEQADGGTLMLDEIGDMSLAAQAKVLKAIEEGWIERVGSSTGKPIRVNVRIIAATNKNLSSEIASKQFREDLYHRLNVLPIHVPPLRQRREDIPLLAKAFADEFAAEAKRKPLKFDEEAMRVLQSLPYTGNIRELRNIVERITILCAGDIIHHEDVERLGLAYSILHSDGGADHSHQEVSRKEYEDDSDDLSRSVILTDADLARLREAGSTAYFGDSTSQAFEEVLSAENFQDFKDRSEKIFITEKLREHNWNISRTAEALDIQRSHLYTKMKKYGLAKERKGEEDIIEEVEPQ